MRKGLAIALLAICAWSRGACAEEPEEFGFGEETAFDRWYGGASGGMILPGGGSGLRRAGRAQVRAGYYCSEAGAVEVEGRWVMNGVLDGGGNTGIGGVAARGVWHWSGWEFADKLIGYERLDPFFLAGAAADFAGRGAWGGRRSAIGPEVGVGFFWHMTDYWSLRAEATAMMAVGGPCRVGYGAAVGVQRSFGGEGEE